STNHMGASD
ncbi:inclusion membrane domain protein, partial [Chlamydia psittaci 84-8471/1]